MISGVMALIGRISTPEEIGKRSLIRIALFIGLIADM